MFYLMSVHSKVILDQTQKAKLKTEDCFSFEQNKKMHTFLADMSFVAGKPSGQTVILNERGFQKEVRQFLIIIANQFKVLSTPTDTSGRREEENDRRRKKQEGKKERKKERRKGIGSCRRQEERRG